MSPPSAKTANAASGAATGTAPETAIRDVVLETEPVELYKILKFEGLADSGGAAKAVIAKGLVWVNGAPETKKRKKIFAGDVIEYKGQRVKAALASSAASTVASPAASDGATDGTV